MLEVAGAPHFGEKVGGQTFRNSAWLNFGCTFGVLSVYCGYSFGPGEKKKK